MGVLEERYLRDDLPCGAATCGTCAAPARPLEPYAAAWPHYCIPAVDALTKYVEVLAPAASRLAPTGQGAARLRWAGGRTTAAPDRAVYIVRHRRKGEGWLLAA
jgi:hypothetical protein